MNKPSRYKLHKAKDLNMFIDDYKNAINMYFKSIGKPTIEWTTLSKLADKGYYYSVYMRVTSDYNMINNKVSVFLTAKARNTLSYYTSLNPKKFTEKFSKPFKP